MRVFEKVKIEYGDIMAEIFDCLPQRAKAMFFEAIEYTAIHYVDDLQRIIMQWNDDYNSCKSPIEKIFFLSFNLVSTIRDKELPKNYVVLSVYPQYEIETKDKKFIVDFNVFLECEDCYKELIVECDGHDFHEKTKKQVAHDNEREYAIKMSGYDILRFSGSQIYNNPFKVANDVFDYLLKMKEVECSGDL